MEVRYGYKLTDLGVIPNDWEIAHLKALCPQDGLVRGPFGGALKKEFFTRDGFKVYEQRNAIYRDVELGSYFISPTKFQELRRFEVRPGDFIVSCSGTIGRIFRMPSEARLGVINQALLKITINPHVINEEFFYHYFAWDQFQNKIIENTHGGAMQNLVGMDVFRNILFPVPPLPEQHAIAEALSDVDAQISVLDGLIAKKRDIKQGAMQELLTGRRRLPGFNKEWEVKRLGDIGRCLRGVSYDGETDLSAHDTQYTVRLLRANNVQNAHIVTDEVQFVNKARVHSDQLLRREDILVCTANGSKELVGKAAIFHLRDEYAYTFGAFMGAFRLFSDIDNPGFVFCLFQTEQYRNYMRGARKAS